MEEKDLQALRNQAGKLLKSMMEQTQSEREETVSQLAQLWEHEPTDEVLTLIYAKGLYNLTVEQDLPDCEDSVSKLSELFEQFPTESIALEYADGLVNLSSAQDLLGRETSVSKLSELFEQFPTESLALVYAKGLFSLSAKQDLSGFEVSVSKLSEFFDTFPKNEAIAFEYAKGLVNLSFKQDLSGRETNVSRLSELFAKFSTESLALAYAKGLANFTVDQDLSGCESSVSKLSELFEQFPTESLALEYAKGLVNLSSAQDLLGRETSVSRLSELFYKIPTESIALEYAGGLFNLTIQQDLSGCEDSISKLEALFHRFENEDIAVPYANMLANLSHRQSLSERKSSVSKLEFLLNRFSKNVNITLYYAMGLFNLALKQELSSVKGTISKIEALMKNFSQETPNFLALLFRYFIEQLLEEDDDTEKIEFIKNQFKEHLVAIDSSVTMAYNELSDVDIYQDIMGAVFYHHHDGDLINHCLKQFGQKLKGSPYEIWLDDARDFDDQSKLLLYNLQKNIKKILHTLAVRDMANLSKLRIGHYTSLEVLKQILVTNHHEWDDKTNQWKVVLKKGETVKIIGRSRFNNANYMNDTQEGELLDQALGFTKEASSLKASNWYLMSLTTSIDDLAMWAQYGKQGEGVALVLHEDSFSVKDDISQHQLLSRQTLSDDSEQKPKEKSYRGETPYRICYLKDGQPVAGLLKGDELVEISSYLKEMREIIEQLGEGETIKRFIDRLLEEIRYLFKSADYKYESEIRFLKYVPYTDTERIMQTSGDFPPKLYIEAEHPIKLKEIIFGPKVKEASNYVPYIRWCDKDVQVSQSQIHFR